MDDDIELVGVVYCADAEAVVIVFKAGTGSQGRVAIPLREFFDRTEDACPERQSTLQ
jgi:hypothetical protein